MPSFSPRWHRFRPCGVHVQDLCLRVGSCGLRICSERRALAVAAFLPRYVWLLRAKPDWRFDEGVYFQRFFQRFFQTMPRDCVFRVVLRNYEGAFAWPGGSLGVALVAAVTLQLPCGRAAVLRSGAGKYLYCRALDAAPFIFKIWRGARRSQPTILSLVCRFGKRFLVGPAWPLREPDQWVAGRAWRWASMIRPSRRGDMRSATWAPLVPSGCGTASRASSMRSPSKASGAAWIST